MSEVFFSYDSAASRPVAVKVLADHLAGDQQFVNRFYREAILSRSLSHPSLVQGITHGFDAVARQHYLVLEFIDGLSAQEVLNRRGLFPVAVAVRVACEVASALSYLHSQRFVHRDVKPDNVLLAPNLPAKLADLGLAKRIHQTDGHLTTPNQGFGTPHYMPIEQAVNAALADARSDIFSLGATLYHLVTGRVPFPDCESAPADPRPPLVLASVVCPQVPPALDEILHRMLANDPQERFQSVPELMTALNKVGLASTTAEYARFLGTVMREPGTVSEPRDDHPTRHGVNP
jgi:serine/threonine-protein kinase